MRLRDIQILLKNNIEHIDPPDRGRTSIDQLRTALEAIVSIPDLGDIARNILAMPYVARFPKGTVVPANDREPAMAMVNNLRHRASELLVAIDGVLPQQNPYSFTVHFPSGGTLRDTFVMLARVEQILRLVGGTATADIRVQNFDSGTLNVEVIAKLAELVERTTKAVGDIAERGAKPFYVRFMIVVVTAIGTVDYGIDVARKVEELRADDMKVEDAKGMVDLNRRMRRYIRDNLEKKAPDLKGDDLNRAVEGTFQLSALIQEKVQIIPPTNAPPEAPKPEFKSLEIPDLLREVFERHSAGQRQRLLEAVERETVQSEGAKD